MAHAHLDVIQGGVNDLVVVWETVELQGGAKSRAVSRASTPGSNGRSTTPAAHLERLQVDKHVVALLEAVHVGMRVFPAACAVMAKGGRERGKKELRGRQKASRSWRKDGGRPAAMAVAP